jgi:hypothetical protein
MLESSQIAFSRRDALKGAALTAAVVGTGGWSAPPPATGLTRSVYTPLVGSSFVLSAHGVRHRARLLPLRDVSRARQRGADLRAETAFALRFRAAGPLPSGLYTVRHHRTGDVLLHLEARPGTKGLLEAVVYAADPRKGTS